MSTPVFISRRQFLGTSLGTSLVLTAFPGSLWAAGVGSQRDSEIVLRCAIMSDVHFNVNPDCVQKQRLEKVMRYLSTYAKDSAHPHFDAVMVVGDMSDHGYAKELIPFRDTLLGNLPKGAQALLCMGNHEFWGGEEHEKVGGGRKNWETIFSRPANTHTVIHGYHFIGVSPEKGSCAAGDYLYALDWLRKQLDIAVQDDPKKPIFVFQHYHIRGTVYGGFEKDWAGVPDLRPLLEEYPQVVDFSGHSHYPANDPRSIWQGNFTALGTATLSYFAMEGGIFNRFPAGYQNAAQVYFMEVFRDNAIHFRIFDAITESFFETEYFLAEPGVIDRYCYTEKRYETATAPYWTAEFAPTPDAPASAEKPEIQISEIYPYCAKVTIPQAHDIVCPTSFLGSYQISLEDRKVGSDEEWTPAGEENPWSGYFFANQPEKITAMLESIDQDREWRVTVRARNVFGKLSEEKITATFQTPVDPDANIQDKNAPFPTADALNFFVSEDGQAVNEPLGKTFSRKLETCGNPTISSGWAVFDGKDDRYRIRTNRGDYARLRRGITFGACFSFDAFRNAPNENIFANTEQGGSGLTINHTKKTLDFWCHVAGQYTILSAPLTVGTHTAYGTYDGKKVILYLDGVPAASKNVSGPLTYTPNDTACAFSIGSDIANNYGGSHYFAGKIRFARVFTWALTPEQIKNLTPETK
ncbi:MAG: LamG-like jellyroll fold domain-containing protein [Planctomycetia bacterium]|nr:LamG-like jellyroll fold domain-containing protein [Planctomycetia bacterium]